VGEERTGQPDPTNQRVTVPEAAELLGITAEAVRMRIKRGTLRSERQGGRVFVLLGQSQPTDRPDEPTTLISEMRSRIQFLEDELQRKDAILLNMTEAMKALSPPSQENPPDERDSPQTVDEEPERGEPRPDASGAQEGVERGPWWRRVFGG
jgi:excisionase family DNA binding protein